MTASVVDWDSVQIFQESEVLGLDESIQDLFHSSLKDKSIARSSKDSI